MKAIRKHVLLLCMLIIAAVCAGLFAACDTDKPNDDNKDNPTGGEATSYTVLVEDDTHEPVKDVAVYMSKGGTRYDAVRTGDDGKATIELAPDTYTVSLVASTIPDGYHAPESVQVTAENTSVTVTLVKDFRYVVNLVDEEGNPFYQEKVTIAICQLEGSSCLTPSLLGTDGKWTYTGAEPGDYKVMITLPSNLIGKYAFEGYSATGHYYTGDHFSATKTEMTITIYKVNAVTDATPLTDEEKAAFVQDTFITFDDKSTVYSFEENLAANKTVYYSITPSFDSEYSIYYKSGSAANCIFNGTDYNLGNNQGTAMYAIPAMEAGKTYFFNVRNNNTEAAKIQFAIEAPSASHTKIKLTGEVDVTIAKEGATAVIEYTPAIGASFKLTGPSDLNTSIVLMVSEYAKANHVTFQKSAECTARFTEDMIGRSMYFSIAVNGAEKYPAAFKVKVEKTTDLKNITTVKHAEEKLSQFSAQEGTLTEVPVDGTVELVYNDTDKAYHLNSVDGPVVVVLLTSPIAEARFFTYDGGASLAYIDKADRGSYPLILDSTVDKTSLTKGNTYDDYRTMLRGFGDYDQKPNNMGGFDLQNPTNITEGHYYVKYVNADGVYPLTKELETFLKAMAKAYPNCMPLAAAKDSEWLFACYYYATEPTPPVEEDVIVGNYVNDEFNLTVSADGKYIITEESKIGPSEYESGTWVKNSENNYTFTYISFETGTYTVTRDENGTLTFVEDLEDPAEKPSYIFEAANGDEPDEPEVDVIVGEYTNEENHTLTVSADGQYSITKEDKTGISEIESGFWIQNNENDYTFTYVMGDMTGTFTVTRGDNGTLTFVEDLEEPVENPEPFYVFEVKEQA